jgi:hypothetical protein
VATRSIYSYAAKAPKFSAAPTAYDRVYHDLTNNALRLYFDQVDNFINGPRPYGVFCSTSTQTNPVANTAMAVTYNVIEEAHGVTVDNGSPDSKVYVAQSGVYNFQFSAQLDKSGGGADAAYIWFSVNGTDIANSASKVVVDGPSSEIIAAWNYITSMRQNDYFQLKWSSPDTNMVLAYAAASSPVPAIPSVILTVTWVSPLIV